MGGRIVVPCGFYEGTGISVQARQGFTVPWVIRLAQGPDAIVLDPAAVPALIEALQAAAKEAGDG